MSIALGDKKVSLVLQCSFEVCRKTYGENDEAVQIYSQQWYKKHSSQAEFRCFYHKDDHNNVILQKRHSVETVIHSMLWPSVVILICGVIFLRLEMQRRRLTWCDQKPTRDEERAGLQAGECARKKKRGDGVGAERLNGKNDGCEAKQTLLQAQNSHNLTTKVDCKIAKAQDGLSSSMPSLDRLKPTVAEYGATRTIQGYGQGNIQMVVPSISVDGLQKHQGSAENVSSAPGLKGGPLPLKDAFRQDSTKTEGGSSTGSQGSKIMGLETPV